MDKVGRTSRTLTDNMRDALRDSQIRLVISVERITRIDATGSLRGFASVNSGKLNVHDLDFVQQDGQSAWVSMPHNNYEQNGKRTWYSIVEVTDNAKAALQDAVLEAWRWC